MANFKKPATAALAGLAAAGKASLAAGQSSSTSNTAEFSTEQCFDWYNRIYYGECGEKTFASLDGLNGDYLFNPELLPEENSTICIMPGNNTLSTDGVAGLLGGLDTGYNINIQEGNCEQGANVYTFTYSTDPVAAEGAVLVSEDGYDRSLVLPGNSADTLIPGRLALEACGFRFIGQAEDEYIDAVSKGELSEVMDTSSLITGALLPTPIANCIFSSYTGGEGKSGEYDTVYRDGANAGLMCVAYPNDVTAPTPVTAATPAPTAILVDTSAPNQSPVSTADTLAPTTNAPAAEETPAPIAIIAATIAPTPAPTVTGATPAPTANATAAGETFAPAAVRDVATLVPTSAPAVSNTTTPAPTQPQPVGNFTEDSSSVTPAPTYLRGTGAPTITDEAANSVPNSGDRGGVPHYSSMCALAAVAAARSGGKGAGAAAALACVVAPALAARPEKQERSFSFVEREDCKSDVQQSRAA